MRDRKRRKRRENIAKNTQSDSLTGTKLLIQSNPDGINRIACLHIIIINITIDPAQSCTIIMKWIGQLLAHFIYFLLFTHFPFNSLAPYLLQLQNCNNFNCFDCVCFVSWIKETEKKLKVNWFWINQQNKSLYFRGVSMYRCLCWMCCTCLILFSPFSLYLTHFHHLFCLLYFYKLNYKRNNKKKVKKIFSPKERKCFQLHIKTSKDGREMSIYLFSYFSTQIRSNSFFVSFGTKCSLIQPNSF